MTRRIAHAAQIGALVLALALVPAALAAKGGGHPGGGTSSSSSISLASPLPSDANGDGLPNYGDAVLFNVSTTATTTPWVNLLCYQSGALVYNGWVGYWDGSLYPTWNFSLTSTAWQGGAADCVAWLDMYTKQGFKQLTSTSFNVGA